MRGYRCMATVSRVWEPYEPCLTLRPCPIHDDTPTIPAGTTDHEQQETT